MSIFQSLLEGGNVKLGDTTAEPIKIHPGNRESTQDDISNTLSAIHDSFQKEHGIHLFGENKKALRNHSAFSGSTHHLMNPAISHEEYSHYKPETGDIDVKVHHEHLDKLTKHLEPGKKFGKYTVVGVKKSGGEAHALLKHENGQVHQFDFEKTNYKNDEPSKFDQFAHSSDWKDTKAGIKGMHHKLLLNAIGRDQHKFSVLYGLKSRTDDSQPWDNSTKSISKTLFGKGADHNNLSSFHGLVDSIKNHVSPEHHQAIYDKFKADLSRHKTINHGKALDHIRKNLNVTDDVHESFLDNFVNKPASDLITLAKEGHPHALAELKRRGININVTEVYHHRDVFRAGIKHKVSSHGGYLIHQNGDSITIKTMNGNKVSTRGKTIDSLSDAIHFINHDLRKGFNPSNPAQRTIREENDLEIGTDKLVYDRRSKTPGENANKPIPYPEALKNFMGLMEAYYPGNVGIMELAKFMQQATEKQKRMFHDHLANSRHEKAMGLVSKVTGMKLHPSAYKTT